MSTFTPPDQATILASLRDYVEQIREEGLEGLSGTAIPASATPVASAARSRSGASRASAAQPIDTATPAPSSPSISPSAVATPASGSAPTSSPPAELFYKYPGLE